MSRWKVTLNGAGGWQVFGTDGRCAARFHTHAEALAYADRMARTREVVLPRGPYEIRGKQNIYEDPITVKPAKHLAGYETVAVGYTTHGVQNGFFLAQDEVRPLALALRALAEQEVRNEPS